ncbi:YncE family protein [Roseomonas elaeocarpi]|uniref:YncE family protein n=1 Tax=Roseomonas elaeocarpi TaxID=907779 RepID=A0ABV6JZE8_9PROT
MTDPSHRCASRRAWLGGGVARRPLLGSALLIAAALTWTLPAAAEPTLGTTRRIAPGLYELVVSDTPKQVYVASAGDRGKDNARILALDPATLEPRGAIELGGDPAFGLAINNRTGMIYTTNTRDGSVSAISVRDNRVVATIKPDSDGKRQVRQVLVDPDHDRAYVSAFAREGDAAIWVVDTKANKVERMITADLGPGITGLALDAAGNRLFATALTTNEVVEIDLSKGAVARRFPSGGEGSINIAFDAARRHLIVANQKSGGVTVLDATDGKLLRTVETGAGALSVTVDAPRNRVFVANRGAGTVTVLDADSLAVLATLATGTHPNTVAVDAATGIAYVSNKAATGPRGAPPVDDPKGDTVSVIRP